MRCSCFFLPWFVLTLACDRATVGGTTAQTPRPTEACALPRTPIVASPTDRNVEGGPLAECSQAPLTGFFRDGRCSTGEADTGVHVVCAVVTEEFLQFTKAHGNDLSSARGGFAGLNAGNRWCLCAARWSEAERAGVAPPVVLKATHSAALQTASHEVLRKHAVTP